MKHQKAKYRRNSEIKKNYPKRRHQETSQLHKKYQEFGPLNVKKEVQFPSARKTRSLLHLDNMLSQPASTQSQII